MRHVRRFHLLALTGAVLWTARLAPAADGSANAESLPGIFAPRRAIEPPPPPALLARKPASSDRVSAMIAERVMERVKELDTSTLPITPPPKATDRVVMDKVIVNSVKEKPVDPTEDLSPAVRFLRSGRFFESRDGNTTGDFRLLPTKPAGGLPKEDVFRLEISVTKKF